MHPFLRSFTLWAILVTLGAMATESMIHFPAPASAWTSTLPVGNGRLGATTHGRPDKEVVVLNEDSFVNGGFQNRVNPKSLQTFPQVRRLMDDGDLTGAGTSWLNGMVGTPQSERKYEPAGYISIDTGHNKPSAYNRSLDLATGISTTSYVHDSITHVRRTVASAADNVIAMHFTADRPNALSMTIKLDRSSGEVATSDSDGGLRLRSSGRDDRSYTHSQYAMVSVSGGTLTSAGSSIGVLKATNVTIMWDAESSFYYPEGQAKYEQVLQDRVRSASVKGYQAVERTAAADHRKYFDRASFSAGKSRNAVSAAKPTDGRLADLKSTRSFEQDPEFLTLAYNYGRYLLIASSRPGSLPANLQGVWNDAFNPPWDAKYTININAQMNYWLADINGMDDMLNPLWDHFKRMQARGTEVAAKMYGLPGWVCHHNTDVWGDCAPQDAGTEWSIWPMGGAWMLYTAVEHYRFTKNVDFAKTVALPLLQNAVKFYNAFSVLQNGYYVTYPSNSPENSYVIPNGKKTTGQRTGIDKSSQSDRALMWHLYTGFIEISEAAGSTAGIEQAKTYLAHIKAPDISPTTNRLLEWSADYSEVEPAHRHFSNCIGLHPGNQYSPLTNATLADAARRLIDHRMTSGGGSTGWSRIWAANLYARLLDGTATVQHITTLMTDYMYSNLWAITSDVFQADANFGLTSAVNEMFLQSHNGIVHLGPAMPKSQLLEGNFKGWKARENFKIDAEWAEGQITAAKIISGSGEKLAIRVQGGRTFMVNGKVYAGAISTIAGQEYVVSF